ncbi:MAG: 2OG-Fe(II) oxygenase [Alphaproteobacteria bacterium]
MEPAGHQPQRIFEVGDIVPSFVLPDRHGARLDFGQQSRAGRVVVLHVVSADNLAAGGRALTALTGAVADGEDVQAFVVAGGCQPGDKALTDDRMLPDPQGLIAKAFALQLPAWLVLDAGFRLSAKAGGMAEALGAVRALAGRSAPDRVRIQAPVLVLPGLFEPAFCSRLMAFWDEGHKVADLVSSSAGDAASGRAYAALKRRTDVAVDDAGITAEIRRRLARRALPQIAAAFQRPVDHFETFRVGCYDAATGGHFGRHRDNTTPYTAHRLFALTANLNGDYEGGELVFPEFGRQRYRPEPGGGVVFSCALLHEALPVTAGRRFGLFGFLFDRAGAEQVGRRLQQERAAGRDPEAAWRSM